MNIWSTCRFLWETRLLTRLNSFPAVERTYVGYLFLSHTWSLSQPPELTRQPFGTPARGSNEIFVRVLKSQWQAAPAPGHLRCSGRRRSCGCINWLCIRFGRRRVMVAMCQPPLGFFPCPPNIRPKLRLHECSPIGTHHVSLAHHEAFSS